VKKISNCVSSISSKGSKRPSVNTLAKEPHPWSFDQGYTKEILKSWPESIALINERILGIQFQLKAKFSNRPAGAGERKGYDAAL